MNTQACTMFLVPNGYAVGQQPIILRKGAFHISNGCKWSW